MRDVNENLGSQLAAATQMSMHLKSAIAEGDGVIRRVSKIASAARSAAPEPEAPEPRDVVGQGGCRRGAGFFRTQKG